MRAADSRAADFVGEASGGCQPPDSDGDAVGAERLDIFGPSAKIKPMKANKVVLLSLQFAGSLTLGITLLAVILIVIALATFIEAEYGTAAAQFVFYANPWFYLLITLLALNILAGALLRLPWKKHHIPFLITHAGILILLFGCYLTWKYGEEAQITLPEGTIGNVAMKPAQQQFEFNHIDHSGESVMVHVPFRPGPFSWRDYQYENWIQDSRRYKTLLWYAMRFVPRNTGENAVPGVDSARFEVIDYLAQSVVEPVPPFEMNILWPNKTVRTVTELGEVREVSRHWEPVRLDLRQRQAAPGLADVHGVSATMSGGERISYNLATNQEELNAFTGSRPMFALPDTAEIRNNSASLWGEIILYYDGKHYSVSVDELLELAANGRYRIEDSGLTIHDVRFRDRGPIIHFSVSTSSEMEAMTLFPDNPELNVQARRLGVFGSYWVDPVPIMQQSAGRADSPMLQRLATQRIDFMQGPDKQLYYRLWSGRAIVDEGVIPNQEGQRGAPIRTQLNLAEGTPNAVNIVIDRFTPQDVPGGRIVPETVNRNQPNRSQHGEQRVQLRVEFDGTEDTFWLRAAAPTVVPFPPDFDQVRYIYGKGQTLAVQINHETIDLGFGILLKQFEKRTEPGMRMSSHYSSLVDYVEPLNDPPVRSTMFSRNLDNYRTLPGGENILISMNRPGFFKGTGAGYRIYQSSYIGPYYPDQPQFHELYDGRVFPWESRPRESIALSTLSVNNDPGRGWKYLGSFLIVLGSAVFVNVSVSRSTATAYIVNVSSRPTA